MSVVETLLLVAEKGHGFAESMEMGQVIDEIWQAIAGVYTKIGGAHFKSAKSAMRAAGTAASPEERRAHLIRATGHLEDAYHVSECALTETRTERFLLVFEDSVPVLDYEQLIRLRASLCEFASTIAITYSEMSNRQAAREWKKQALQYVNDYAIRRTWHFVARSEVFGEPGDALDRRYISYSRRTWRSGSGSWTEIEDKEISSEGRKFILEQRQIARQDIERLFQQKRIT